jgi:hypothetical protein
MGARAHGELTPAAALTCVPAVQGSCCWQKMAIYLTLIDFYYLQFEKTVCSARQCLSFAVIDQAGLSIFQVKCYWHDYS